LAAVHHQQPVDRALCAGGHSALDVRANPDDHKAKCGLYQAECAKHGRDYALGEHTGILKIAATGKDRAETIRKYDRRVTRDFA
jgi:hypothetical protein